MTDEGASVIEITPEERIGLIGEAHDVRPVHLVGRRHIEQDPASHPDQVLQGRLEDVVLECAALVADPRVLRAGVSLHQLALRDLPIAAEGNPPCAPRRLVEVADIDPFAGRLVLGHTQLERVKRRRTKA